MDFSLLERNISSFDIDKAYIFKIISPEKISYPALKILAAATNKLSKFCFPEIDISIYTK